MASITFRRRAQPVPAALRSNFAHLYADIAWYGVLSGSAITFITVYATRLGATGFQLGLLSAGPAAVTLLVTLPAGRWLEHRPLGPAVFWTSILNRGFYLMWVLLPFLFSSQGQLWAVVATTLLMSIPGAALAVGFNALYADAVPREWRGHVAGTRNALLSVAFVASTLLSGLILQRVPFPAGYQIVFAMGVVGAAMSSLHLAFLRSAGGRQDLRPSNPPLDLAAPGRLRPAADNPRPGLGLRFLMGSGGRQLLRTDVLAGHFGRLVAVLFAFHLTQYLPIPLFPLYWVNQVHFSDGVISLGQAFFYAAVFVGSTQLGRISRRLSYQQVTALGVVLLAFYPALTAIMQGVGLFLLASLVGGLAWSLAGGALANYVLDATPENDRPAHLAWYNLALNAAILLGALLGPLLAHAIGLPAALLLAAAGRALAGVLIWRWG